ncbi:lytic polysaccharide monooxygenase [Pseudoalteromonas 'SMAR']|uniref:lytic polysaccharide monooxygenase n=1 Tax=Pseudoalteromonas 'SMAR' TaxID=3416908 RepID=UPI003AF294D0
MKVINKPLFLFSIFSSAMMLSTQLMAHGYMDFPKARQAYCQQQGGYWWPKDGSNIPNQACRAAFLQSGHYPFVQHHEFAKNVADYHSLAAVKRAIPDGTLCAAGDVNKDGMNLPSHHWQRTPLEPDGSGNIEVRFRATTPHNPSFWQFFLTKADTEIGTKALNWQDLQLIAELGDQEVVLDPNGNRYYEMQVPIPAGRTGDAILYTRWQREDAAGEGFYNCSDITLVDPSMPTTWFDSGFFIKPGQQAEPGDSVWFRAFDASGDEFINTSLAIDQNNQNQWVTNFSRVLTERYANQLKIGVRNEVGEIHFDSDNLLSNVVYLTEPNFTATLSVIKAQTNTPPVVEPIADVELTANESITIVAQAFDEQNDPLNYAWQLPAELQFTASGEQLVITAPTLEQDTRYDSTLAVSDGKSSSEITFSVFVTSPNTNPPATWQANKVYVAGDKVTFENAVYQAKWWTRGEEPGDALVWQAL